MKNLILVRHAKSSWDMPVQDKERCLTPQGKEDALFVAQQIAPFLPSAYHIWSSTGKRAMETAHIFEKVIPSPIAPIDFKDVLYTFDCSVLENTIKSAPQTIQNAIVFGHNPAITDFVNAFSDLSIDNVPTAGVVWIAFETENWQTIKKGTIKKTIFPKDLK